MTSNQLQAALNQETERHNRASEELEAERNQIQSDKVALDDRHNQAMEMITKKYNDTYLELQKAQGDRKLDIQAELARIEQEKQDIAIWYDTEMIALKTREQNLAELGYGEEVRWHDVQESQREYELGLQAKKIEFQNSEFLLENQLAIDKLNFEMKQWEDKYLLDSQRTMLDYKQLQFEQSKWYNTQSKEVQSRIFQNLISPFTNMFSGGMRSLPLLFP